MTSPTARRADPLDHDDYLRRRDELKLSYTESIKEYDRLVTWASAGALGLSITFLEKFGQNADRKTAWLLGVGWISLGAAFASSLWSQYFSSRIHSWRWKELDHLQLALTDRATNWATEADRLELVASRYGAATRRLTFVSGLLLIGGIVFVASFAFANAPFKSVATSQDPRTATEPGTFKKGLEYVPEPVARPQSAPQPAPTPPPTEKR